MGLDRFDHEQSDNGEEPTKFSTVQGRYRHGRARGIMQFMLHHLTVLGSSSPPIRTSVWNQNRVNVGPPVLGSPAFRLPASGPGFPTLHFQFLHLAHHMILQFVRLRSASYIPIYRS